MRWQDYRSVTPAGSPNESFNVDVQSEHGVDGVTLRVQRIRHGADGRPTPVRTEQPARRFASAEEALTFCIDRGWVEAAPGG